MKIAIVIPSLSAGGAERVVSTLANEWAKCQGLEVHVVTFTNHSDAYLLDHDIIRYNALKGEKSTAGRFGYLPVAINLRRYCLVKGVDVVVSFLEKFNLLVLGTFLFSGVPVVVCDRNSPWRPLPTWIRLARRVLYPHASAVIVQTNRAVAETQCRTASKNIIPIPNPIAKIHYKATTDCKENIILSVGRLVPQKDHALLLQAFSLCCRRDWSLVIVGDGPLRQELDALVSELGLQRKVRLVGESNDMAYWYSRAKIFCLSSSYEGFPNALLEAMYFGLACVSTDCDTGPRELLDDGEVGVLVDVGDKVGLCHSLDYLMKNTSARQRLGNLAQKSARKYDRSVIASKFIDCIRRSAF